MPVDPITRSVIQHRLTSIVAEQNKSGPRNNSSTRRRRLDPFQLDAAARALARAARHARRKPMGQIKSTCSGTTWAASTSRDPTRQSVHASLATARRVDLRVTGQLTARAQRSLPLADREAVQKPGPSGADQILLAAATRWVREIPKIDTRRIADKVVVSDHRGSLAA
jgi:hypothetical protein